MLIVIWPLLIAIIGLLMYALNTQAKLVEIGKIIFFCGFFFVVSVVASSTFSIGK